MKPVIYLDIENTIIDSLDNTEFLADNCERIKSFITARNPSRVNIFTWGWKTHEDIQGPIVKALFDKLEISEDIRGNVITKEVSVNEAILMGWLDKDDFDRALEPGMMGEFGISKISCFSPMVSGICIKTGCDCILIDDLVDKFEKIEFSKGRVLLFNPEDLNET